MCKFINLSVKQDNSITINHNMRIKIVMLVEIPDIGVILGVILAFVIGVVGFYIYHKVRPPVKSNNEAADVLQAERLEYYEKQLIDMKIRLDAIENQEITHDVTENPNAELKQLLERLVENKTQETQSKKDNSSKVIPEKIGFVPNTEHLNLSDYVLHLITTKAMTSRDIQITLKKSREHTSRLMKKLFEEGYVERSVNSKPFTYSITQKGREKLERQTTATPNTG